MINWAWSKRNTWLTFELGLILFYIRLGLIKRISQAEIPLEKYEYVLDLSVKQFVILLSPISLGHIMCGLCKTKHQCC